MFCCAARWAFGGLFDILSVFAVAERFAVEVLRACRVALALGFLLLLGLLCALFERLPFCYLSLLAFCSTLHSIVLVWSQVL